MAVHHKQLRLHPRSQQAQEILRCTAVDEQGGVRLGERGEEGAGQVWEEKERGDVGRWVILGAGWGGAGKEVAIEASSVVFGGTHHSTVTVNDMSMTDYSRSPLTVAGERIETPNLGRGVAPGCLPPISLPDRR